MSTGTHLSTGTHRGSSPVTRTVRRLRRAVVRSLAWWSMALTRPRARALVYGAPDTEENSLVTAIRLDELYQGEVVLVCTDPARTAEHLELVRVALGRPPHRVRLMPLRKWTVLRAYARAELVLYTHGLFFSPTPPGRRLHVNLWHGTGPKLSVNANFRSTFTASLLSTASPVWGRQTARALGMPDSTELVPGNARLDMLVQQPSRDVLGRLGWDPAAPFVVWMPTYRRSADVSVGTVLEGVPLLRDAHRPGGASVGSIARAAREHGVLLVLKPHPFDAEALAALELPVLTTDQVWAAGLSLYQLLSLSCGIISDYSSAWVDLLGSGRSVGLFCPDLEDYEAERGFNRPSMREVSRGMFLETDDDVSELFAAAAAGRVFRAQAQDRCRTVLGVRPPVGSRCCEMLDAVRRAGVASRHRHAFGLRPPPR